VRWQKQVWNNFTERARKRGQPYRILIVDDEQWIREVFAISAASRMHLMLNWRPTDMRRSPR